MSQPNDGGPAFPATSPVVDHVKYGELFGMSLRDWFAGMAMQGIASIPSTSQYDYKSQPLDKYASLAYQYADAMLAERNKGERGAND